MSQDRRVRQLLRLARAGDAEAQLALRVVLSRLKREPWRATPAAFAHHVSGGRWHRARHLDHLSSVLARAAFTPDQRVVVSMPVRHGKSWLTSMWFPVWFLDRFPEKKVMLVGHGANFAAKWGRRVRNLIRRHRDLLRVELAPDLQAAGCWETPQGGGMITAGIGGQINGEGADLLLIDDYCKNAQQANSQAWREHVVEFWDSTAETRLEPGASVVIVATRWHEADLIGHLLRQEDEADPEDGDVEHWERVTFPAIAEEADALGRAPGEALWPERWPLWRLRKKRRAKGPWVWAALYQQRPSPAEGGVFKRHWIRYYTWVGDRIRYRCPMTGDLREVRLEALRRFCTVDLAASLKESADWTVVATWGQAPDGTLLLLGVARDRVEGPAIVPLIQGQLDRWGAPAAWIESQGFQLHVVQQARRYGLRVRELRADRDKLSRALPATAELEAGAVLFPAQAEWLEVWEAELLAFPGGAHDDQVDTLSYAVQVAIELGEAGLPTGLADVPPSDDPGAWGDDEDDDERDLIDEEPVSLL